MNARFFGLIFFLCGTAFSGFSQENLEIYLDQKRFYSPDGSAFLEVYLQVNASSVFWKKMEDGKMESAIEVTEILKQGEKVIDFRKQIVQSPPFVDSTIADYIDQHRFSVPAGEYELEVLARDLYKEDAVLRSFEQKLSLLPESTPFFSDIQLVESFQKSANPGPATKSGYDLVPFVSYYFSPELSKIAWYAEFYDLSFASEDEGMVVFQYIEDAEKKNRINDLSRFSKHQKAKVIPLLGVFNITKLQTGNYNLVLEARNRNNEMIAQQKIFFQRYNPGLELTVEELARVDVAATFVKDFNNLDSLREFVACLKPISRQMESVMIDRLTKSSDTLLLKQFFYSFWSSRDPLQPFELWRTYKVQVDYTNRIFGTSIKRGYQSDRGMIYLKYGAPDDVLDRPNEPSSYPYQIWHYFKIGRFNNKRFVFYQPDLVTNDYQMLHSDLPGEIKNYRWQQVLNSRNSADVNIDDPMGGNPNHWGGNSEEFFRNPR